MKKYNALLALALSLAGILTAILIVYDIRLDDDAYNLLLKNRFTGLGFGITLCNEKNRCMDDHKSKFEIWHFAHTVHGGLAENRLYPAIIKYSN